MIYDTKGQVYENIEIHTRGLGFKDVQLDELISGTFFYSLILDGLNAGSKKMVIAR
jgi:hypothetical protein